MWISLRRKAFYVKTRHFVMGIDGLFLSVDISCEQTDFCPRIFYPGISIAESKHVGFNIHGGNVFRR